MPDAPHGQDGDYPTTVRTRIRRERGRGTHERAAVHAILDASPLCHVGYTIDGAPFVTPTLQWRDGGRVYWHGSAASRFLRRAAGTQVCLTCTLMDGYVLARSAFNHSVNYRSAMVFGSARLVEDNAAKREQLRRFTETLFPGRWDSLRPMTPQEMQATSVLWMDIDEATAKIRAGPPDDPEDADFPVWAGVLPIQRHFMPAQPAPDMAAGIEFPEALKEAVVF